MAITFFGSTIFLIILLLMYAALCLYADYERSGYTILGATIIFFALGWWGGTFELAKIFTLANLGIYLGVGIIYSLLRTYLFGVKKREWVKTEKKEPYNSDSEVNEEYNRKKLREELKDNVARWFLAWPFSLIIWTFTELLDDFFRWVWTSLKEIYYSVLELGLGK